MNFGFSDPMRDYSDCYATLGVTSDVDWKGLRARYRRLIGQWHPDRFSSDPSGRKIAEEKSKEITLAYQALERYHRDYGVLPPMQRASPRSEPPPQGEPAARVIPRAGTDARPADAVAEAGTRRPRRFRRFAFLLAVLSGAVYLAQRYLDEPEPSASETVESTPTQEAAPPRETPIDELRAPGGIRVGSTLGEVYAIQGVPSTTQGETWYYGKSRIRFERGRVISWEEHLDNPLRIDHKRMVLLQERLFSVGSTKDEVRAVQGMPSAESGNVWYYGSSKVYFERDRVAHWEESPLQPLRVAR